MTALGKLLVYTSDPIPLRSFFFVGNDVRTWVIFIFVNLGGEITDLGMSYVLYGRAEHIVTPV